MYHILHSLLYGSLFFGFVECMDDDAVHLVILMTGDVIW